MRLAGGVSLLHPHGESKRWSLSRTSDIRGGFPVRRLLNQHGLRQLAMDRLEVKRSTKCWDVLTECKDLYCISTVAGSRKRGQRFYCIEIERKKEKLCNRGNCTTDHAPLLDSGSKRIAAGVWNVRVATVLACRSCAVIQRHGRHQPSPWA